MKYARLLEVGDGVAGGEPVADDLDIVEIVHVGAVETDYTFVDEIFGILLSAFAIESGKRSIVALNHDSSFYIFH